MSQPNRPRRLAWFALPAAALTLAGCQYFAPKRPALVTVPSASPPPLAGTSAASTLAPYVATTFALLHPRSQAARIPVIMYHDVMLDRGRESAAVNCTRDEFVDQIDWLAAQGATFLSLEQLHRHLTRGETVPAKSVVLTFDDNYQGFFDNAYPLLKERKIPCAMFVHTNFVGDTKGHHPKMDWGTLRVLDKEGLVTVCSHTLSHPENLDKLAPDQQATELIESKAILERELAHPVPFFAYPVGNADATTVEIAQRAGYTMAFTMHNAPVEESPGVLLLNRYNYTQMHKGWEECQAAAANAPAAVVEMPLAAQEPVTLHVAAFAGVKLGLVRGGVPTTWRSATGGRLSVGEFIGEATGKGVNAVAGMNGTFFADSNLRGTGNAMIGPCRTYADPVFYPELDPYRLLKIQNRPLVLFGPNRLAILPFNGQTMNDDISLKTFMPDYTDVFLAGAWIVHDGVARTKSEMGAYSARDFNDPRRRAFFGVTDKGQIVLGGSLDVVTTEKLAQAAASAGLKEAVLMDSGFSTSIVFDKKIIVTGHTAKDLPSRAVPHGIVVSGTLELPTEPGTLAALQSAEASTGTVSAAQAQAQAPPPGGGSGGGHRRARRRR